MRHKDCDILYVEDGGKAEETERLAKQRVANTKKYPNVIKQLKEKKQKLLEEKDKASTVTLPNGFAYKTSNKEIGDKVRRLGGEIRSIDDDIQSLEEEIGAAQKAYDELVFSQRSKAYSRILLKPRRNK
jgi:septation ring formation regulator EzrA